MGLLWRILNGLMLALFVFAAALQYNDPEPVRWMAIYLAAALPCWFVVSDRSSLVPLPAAVVGAISAVWALVYVARGVPTVSPLHMFDEWEMKNQQVLETRELFGLAIVAVWMVVVLAVSRRARHRT